MEKNCEGRCLNFSKSGIGLSVGGKGGRLSIGPKGTYVSGGIPGTGISYREKISSGHSQNTGSRGQQHLQDVPITVRISVDEETGKDSIELFDQNGNAIDNQSVRRRILQKEDVKVQVEKCRLEAFKKIVQDDNDFINAYKEMPKIVSEREYHEALENINEVIYVREIFPKQVPTESSINETLKSEAKKEVRTWKFWKLSSLRSEYVQSHFEERMKRELDQYAELLYQFDEEQKKRKNFTLSRNN